MTVAFCGAQPENIHPGCIAGVNAQGAWLASQGDVDSPSFTRSALKPVQAMPLVAQATERHNLQEADMALLCASHSGESSHVQRVAALLASIGTLMLANARVNGRGRNDPALMRAGRG